MCGVAEERASGNGARTGERALRFDVTSTEVARTSLSAIAPPSVRLPAMNAQNAFSDSSSATCWRSAPGRNSNTRAPDIFFFIIEFFLTGEKLPGR